MDPRLVERLTRTEERLKAVEQELSDPAVATNPDKLRDLGRERSEIAPAVGFGVELRGLQGELAGAKELAKSDDPEMKAMADEEVSDLEARVEKITISLRAALVPKDPLDDRPAVIEIRAGTGGDEAGLFAAELMRMYRRMAERRSWTVEVMSISDGIAGAIKEAIFIVKGRGVFGQLRYESGVHRVQRVPETESQGRIHTSAASVAVLPEAEDVDVDINTNDLRIDVFRSSGPGGQSVNTTDSAVRITHLPTGLVVSCQDEKSQLKNKAKAMKVLRSRLLDLMMSEQEAERSAERRDQIGSGDRSAKIRTYNFPQNRLTDHRIGLTLYRLGDIMDGDLTEVIAALRLARDEERLDGAGA